MPNIKFDKFLSDLAVKAGINIDSPEFKAIATNPQVLELEIDDTIVNGINAGLMNEAAALSNKNILNKARAEAYNNVDRSIETDIMELLDDDFKTQLSQQKFTVDKSKIIRDQILKLKNAKTEAQPGDKKVFQDEINKLQGELKTIKEANTKEVTDLKSANDGLETKYLVREQLMGRPYLLAGDTPESKSFAIETAWMKVQQDLAAKGLKIVRENGNLAIKTSDDRSPFDAQNNPIVLQNFIDGAISPLLAPNKKAEGEGNPPPDNAGGSGSFKNSSTESALEALAFAEKSLG